MPPDPSSDHPNCECNGCVAPTFTATTLNVSMRRFRCIDCAHRWDWSINKVEPAGINAVVNGQLVQLWQVKAEHLNTNNPFGQVVCHCSHACQGRLYLI